MDKFNLINDFYCQKVLPLVYDNSLSYYEVLLKLQYHVNEVIKNQNIIIDYFVNFKKYVEEKLQDYTEQTLQGWLDDGTIDNLINVKKFNELKDELMNEITIINNNLGDINPNLLSGIITNKTVYATKNKQISSDNALMGTNGYVNNINLTSTNPEYTLDSIQEANNIQISSSIIHHPTRTAINFQKGFGKHLRVINNLIKGKLFGVLLNDVRNGKGLIVANNNIETEGGDGIEINTPRTSYDSFRGSTVLGNIITTDLTTPNTGTGFGIGIAQGQDVSIIGNVIEGSAKEGLHIEDCTENLVVSGNVFNNCHENGALIQYRDKTNDDRRLYAKQHIITNNHFQEYNLGKTSTGIWVIYDTYGSTEMINLSNNRVVGFDTGLNIAGIGSCHANIDGTIVENCNTGISISSRNFAKIKGNLFIKNVSNYAIRLASASGEMDSIIIHDAITYDKIYQNEMATNAIFKIGKIDYVQNLYISENAEPVIKMPLILLPKYFNGKITLHFKYTGLISSCIIECKYINKELTVKEVNQVLNNVGTYVNSSTPLTVENGVLYANLTKGALSNVTIQANTILDGDFIISK